MGSKNCRTGILMAADNVAGARQSGVRFLDQLNAVDMA